MLLPAKLPSSISLTLEGIIIVFSFWQFENAYDWIDSIVEFSSKVIFSIELFKKHSLPIYFTLDGILIVFKYSQLENVPCSNA